LGQVHVTDVLTFLEDDTPTMCTTDEQLRAFAAAGIGNRIESRSIQLPAGKRGYIREPFRERK